MQTDRGAQPWYRQVWPWLLAAPPLAAVIGGLLTLGLALRFPDYDVRGTYRRDGLGLYEDSSRDEAALARGLSARLAIAPDGTVSVALDGSGDVPARLVVHFTHATLADHDRIATLVRNAGHAFAGHMERLDPARWNVELLDGQGSWRLTGVMGPGDSQVRMTPRADGTRAQ